MKIGVSTAPCGRCSRVHRAWPSRCNSSNPGIARLSPAGAGRAPWHSGAMRRDRTERKTIPRRHHSVTGASHRDLTLLPVDGEVPPIRKRQVKESIMKSIVRVFVPAVLALGIVGQAGARDILIET